MDLNFELAASISKPREQRLAKVRRLGGAGVDLNIGKRDIIHPHHVGSHRLFQCPFTGKRMLAACALNRRIKSSCDAE